MKTTVYNKNKDKIDIEITDYDGEFEVVSCQIQTNDISQEIFTGILGTELKLNILTADNNLYTGSLIGKNINITLNTSNKLHYTIISNVASMPANFIQEEIEICAVDDLTMLKNKRYEKKSYLTLKEILIDILGNYIILGGWGGTEGLLNLIFNTATLYTDEGHTPPTQYEVIEALMKYINRSLLYDSSKSTYILFNPNVLKKEKTVAKGVKVSKNGTTQSVNEIIPVNYINYATVAQSDKTVTLLDPWESAQVTSSFDEIKTQVAKGQYKETEDVGVKTIGGKKVKYSAYFGDAGGNHYAPSIGNIEKLTINNIEKAVANGEYGGCLVNLATSEIKDNDAEGTRTGDEYIMLYGCKNTTELEAPPLDYMYALTPLYEYTLKTDTITDSDTVAVVQDTIIYSDYPFPFESGEFICYNPNIIMQFAYNSEDFNEKYGFDMLVDFNGNAKQYKGKSLTTVNEVTWASRLKNKGVILKLKLSDKGTIYLNTLRFRMLPNMWSHYGYGNLRGSITARPSQYEFHKLSVAIEKKRKVEEELFETDTIIKAINDYSHGITINGNQFEEKPKFVTYDGKKAGVNCVYLDCTQSEENAKPNYMAAGGMDDDENYYNRALCTSEERFVADIDAHYFRNLFSEKVTLRGIKPFFSIYKESFFNKKMLLTSATINITEGETTVSLQEI